MAGQAQGPRGGMSGTGTGFRRRHRVMSDINVTPFVDVMLVLLIVFMVAAPLLATGVPIDLPQTKARALPEDKEPLAVTIKSDGSVYLQDQEVTIDELGPKLLAISEAKRDDRIYVRGDNAAQYGKVAEVMGALNGAGFSRVALVTEPPKK